ncbi:MAG: hypothetical protein PHP74_05025, partial [Candidatus Gracilibacteria bacterium]|nr:hypothetical protein [Candidatus Gracilibacteria bacterium]
MDWFSVTGLENGRILAKKRQKMGSPASSKPKFFQNPKGTTNSPTQAPGAGRSTKGGETFFLYPGGSGIESERVMAGILKEENDGG